VINQRPAPGTPLEKVNVATLWLERRARPDNPIDGVIPGLDSAGGVPRGRP
jgi:hypothetical protein